MPPKKFVGWKPPRLDESGESAGPSTVQPVVPLRAQQQVELPTVIDPSTTPWQDAHMQKRGSEEQIVRLLCPPARISGEATNDQESEEITMYKYSLNSQVVNCWADGDLSTYCFVRRRWVDKIAVKFYVLEVHNKEDAAKISRKVDALFSMKSYTNVCTPIFQVYNERVNSVILCYPRFDLHLGAWLESNTEHDTVQDAGQNLLRPIWLNFIRDTLSCIEPINKMEISKFGELSSYVWKAQSKSIKIIIFPIENKTIGVDKALVEFSNLLKDHIRPHWLHPELQSEMDAFITFLKFWPEKPEGIRQFWTNLADNPVLQDYEGIASLIRLTWRPKSSLSPNQTLELKLNIICPAWKQVVVNDPVMKLMLSSGSYTDDPLGLFTFIKDVAAHYTEKYWACKNLPRDPSGPKHPVCLIKDTYHRVIAQVYMLSKKTRWLQ